MMSLDVHECIDLFKRSLSVLHKVKVLEHYREFLNKKMIYISFGISYHLLELERGHYKIKLFDERKCNMCDAEIYVWIECKKNENHRQIFLNYIFQISHFYHNAIKIDLVND